MTKKSDKSVYLACPKERSQPRKNLLFCLSECKDRCDSFALVPDEKILAVIKEDEGRHDLKYDQLKLFPMPKSKRRY